MGVLKYKNRANSKTTPTTIAIKGDKFNPDYSNRHIQTVTHLRKSYRFTGILFQTGDFMNIVVKSRLRKLDKIIRKSHYTARFCHTQTNAPAP